MQKKKIAIIYGGPGGEHEVSVRSAKNILANIDREKYEVKEFFLSKTSKVISKKIVTELKSFLVWPIFHGEFGEGGYVQQILEKNKIKFIGSSSKVSKNAIDKFKTQKILEKHKILVPKSRVVTKIIDLKNLKLNHPLILKPLTGGSSISLYKTKTIDESYTSLKQVLISDKKVLVQEFVDGREFTCGVIGTNKKTTTLPVSEVVLGKQDIFDYNAKYNAKGLEITPAQIDLKLAKKIQTLSKKVHTILGCSGVTRTDMILTKEGKLFVLEINTTPGMTPVSFIPEQLKCAGISILKFIDILVNNN